MDRDTSWSRCKYTILNKGGSLGGRNRRCDSFDGLWNGCESSTLGTWIDLFCGDVDHSDSMHGNSDQLPESMKINVNYVGIRTIRRRFFFAAKDCICSGRPFVGLGYEIRPEQPLPTGESTVFVNAAKVEGWIHVMDIFEQYSRRLRRSHSSEAAPSVGTSSSPTPQSV